MALTVRDSNLSKDVLVEAIQAEFAGKQALAGSGAALLVDGLPVMQGSFKAGTGTKVQVPYFDSLGELEDVAEGGALTPRALTSTLEEATIIRSGIAGEITNWAVMVAQAADPYQAIAQQFVRLALRRIDKGLIDVAKATSLSFTETDGSGTINIDTFTEARSLFGDEDDEIVLAVVHSFVMKKIRLLKDLSGHPLFKEYEAIEGNRTVRRSTFMGIPVMQSDRLTPDAGTPTVYPSLICKRGALVAWYNGLGDIKQDTDILADTEVQAMHLYHAEHLYKRPANGTKPGVVRVLTTET